jgi:tetratricopeptide (TPR) repeat protein
MEGAVPAPSTRRSGGASTIFWKTSPKTMLSKILLPMVLAAATALAQPADESALFEQGNRAYAEGEYGAARDAYEQLVKAGSRNPSVFLNLGHADYRLGREAGAAINYRRALALDPGNTAARSSLEHVLQKLGVPAPGLGAPEILGQYISFDLLSLAGSMLFWAGTIVLVFAVFSAKRRLGLAALGVLAAVVGATFVALAWAGDSRIALAKTSIVVGDAVDARSTPADNAQKLADLPLGTPVRVIAARDDWSLVRLPLGVDGWVRSAALEPVFPGALPGNR